MAFTTYDNAPYLYRKSGGGGDKEIDKLVGGTIAWNQLIKNGNFADTSNWAASSDSSFTVSNNVATFRAGARYRSLTQQTPTQGRVPKLNHVYMGIIKAKSYTNTDTFFYVRTVTSAVLQTATKTLKTTEKEYVNVLKVTQESYYFQFMVQDDNASGYGDITIQNARFFDLTLMFGSTIADYVYSLEQSSTGSGLAWLRSYGFFTEDYYDYNSGELKSVSNLVSHDMTGKNLLDTSTAEIGTAWNGASNSARARLVIPLAVGKTYTLKANGTSTLDIWYGIETNTMPPSSAGSALSNPYTFTATTKYLLLGFNKTAIASSDIEALKLQLELGSTATSYEPYTLHSYPLGDVTLRGVPKLNGNALYYDGDTYESNGTVTRRYIALTVNGLERWGKEADGWMSAQGVNSFYLSLGANRANYKNDTSAVNATSNRLLVASYNEYRGTNAQPNWFTFTGVGAYIDISSTLSTVDEFKAWLQSNPVTVVYELATPTTETADTYTNPQWVDPNGTERYTLSANAFPMPVGHETTYNTDMGSKTVNTQVNLSMTEPSVRQIYAKEGDTARVLNIHLDQTEEDGTLRILRPDGTEVTAEAVLVPEFYDGLMAEIPSDATEIVGKCYCDVEQNGVSSMPFTLNVKKNERES